MTNKELNVYSVLILLMLKKKKFLLSKKSKGKDTLSNFSFRVFHEIHFQGHFMKHEILS